jgi:hypothetical protein
VPEYRLRQLVNQGLGYSSFAGFLNFYRIADVKAALADPAPAKVPILTIALDAGSSSAPSICWASNCKCRQYSSKQIEYCQRLALPLG